MVCLLSIAVKCMQTHVATNSAKADVECPASSPETEISGLFSATAPQAISAARSAGGVHWWWLMPFRYRASVSQAIDDSCLVTALWVTMYGDFLMVVVTLGGN